MIVKCKTCSVEFEKIPSQIRKTNNNFCSRSCAGKFNNSKFPKRKRTNHCKTCSTLIWSGRTYCEKCLTDPTIKKGLIKNANKKDRIRNPQIKKVYLCPDCNDNMSPGAYRCRKCIFKIVHQRGETLTLKEMINDKRDKSSSFASIRGRARTIAKNLGWKSCSNCGYDKHVEICHKKDIASFPLDATVGEINHQDNLIALCPNCHWEFDHGMIEI